MDWTHLALVLLAGVLLWGILSLDGYDPLPPDPPASAPPTPAAALPGDDPQEALNRWWDGGIQG